MYSHVLIAHLSKGLFWKLVILTFNFLQTKDIGLMLLKILFHNSNAQSHGVDVPSSQLKV
jgi:hypothetical protein